MDNQYAPYGRIDDLNSTPMAKGTRNEILLVSGIIGLCLIVFHYLGLWMGKGTLYLIETGAIPYNYTMVQIIQIVYTLATILLPFAIGAWFIKRVQKRNELVPLAFPKSGILFVEAVGIGCMAIVVANFITAGYVAIMNGFGFSFDNYKPESPTGLSETLWILLSNAFVPALVEEYVLRGVILQSLRKYGDAFAVFASALIFGVMHGNATQAPFAFILGAVLAMLVIMTGSLWTSITVHLINNTYSVMMTTVLNTDGELTASMAIVSLNILGLIYGAVALIYLFGLHNGKAAFMSRYMPGGPSPVGIRSYRRKAWLYTLISPTMLIAFVIMIVDVLKTVHYTG